MKEFRKALVRQQNYATQVAEARTARMERKSRVRVGTCINQDGTVTILFA